MSDFTETLTKIEAIENTHERVDVSNFYVSNHLRENDCCIPSEDWRMILDYDYDPWCLIGDITEHWTPELKRKVAKIWWKEFEYIETNDYGMTIEPFMFWSEGTDQFDIMEAFKDFFDIDVIEDKDFMSMVGFVNGDYLVNTLKKNQEEKEMSKEKETTIHFADGTHADVFRHGHNEYSIYFDYTESTVYGSYLDVAKAIEDYKEKMTYTNKQKDDEENYPMMSCGEYLNFWTTEGDYDVFIIFHELQENTHYEECEKIVHHIMSYRKPNDTKEKLADKIHTALEILINWEQNDPYVFITKVKGSDN